MILMLSVLQTYNIFFICIIAIPVVISLADQVTVAFVIFAAAVVYRMLLTVGALFLPKLYICRFKPELNRIDHLTGSHDGTGGTAFTFNTRAMTLAGSCMLRSSFPCSGPSLSAVRVLSLLGGSPRAKEDMIVVPVDTGLPREVAHNLRTMERDLQAAIKHADLASLRTIAMVLCFLLTFVCAQFTESTMDVTAGIVGVVRSFASRRRNRGPQAHTWRVRCAKSNRACSRAW